MWSSTRDEAGGRVIVVGASSGGIDALRVLVGALPRDFATPICIVQHTGPSAPGILHQILERAGNLPAVKVVSAMPLLAPGLYVAPPDFHLIVEQGVVRVTKGPRENRSRPAIDPLFRSAAYSYGSAAIGVVLTGNLDDGTSGLWTIKEYGGIAVAQDPADALYPSMPQSAIRHVAVDHVVPVADLAALLVALTAAPVDVAPARSLSAALETEVRIANGRDARQAGVMQLGTPSQYTCPDCRGVLLEVPDGGVPRFRCHTGHAYSIQALTAAVCAGIDETMWAAVRAMDEGAALLEQVARDLHERDDGVAAARLKERAAARRRQADQVRRMIDPESADE